MSEIPKELRQLLAEGKRALEPEPARLDAVYLRVLRAPPIPSEYDLPPSASRGLPWSWFGAGALLIGAVLWLGSPAKPPQLIARVEPAEVVEAAPAVEPTIASSAPIEEEVEEAPVARTSRRVRHVTRPPQQVPSSDWPVKLSQPLQRPPAIAPIVAEPVLPAAVEPSDAASVHEETPTASTTVRMRTSAPTAAATLRSEVQLIARARKALDAGDWAAAQRALDEHLIEHPIGQLHVERRALLARARCMAGDIHSARRLHAELLTLVPGSSLVRSVERACPQLAP